MRFAYPLLAVLLLALVACATPRPGTPVLAEDATVPRADVYVFNVSRGTVIPFRRYVTIDGFPLVRLDATDGGVYYVAAGYHPRRAWLAPVGSHPIFLRRISEAEALRLFTE